MSIKADELLREHMEEIKCLCRKYRVTRLRVFGSALGNDWDEKTSDLDFLANFKRPSEIDEFEQLMGFILDLEALLGRKVDVVDWAAAKNPFFRRHAESQAKELYAA